MIWIAAALALGLVAGGILLRMGMRWGSTHTERAREMPGDDYLEPVRPGRTRMTRAISLGAPPEQVWPWIAQLGRGAGWYSIDWLDNGRRVSARHIVSWIPEPRPGDATVIGYLRHIEAGRSVAWWADGAPFIGARARLVSSFLLEPEGRGTRLVSRMSADATGISAHVALLVFRLMDSIMARRQLLGIRERVELAASGAVQGKNEETGERDQYQKYEVLYAAGEGAGVAGCSDGARWRRAAINDGVIRPGR